MANLAYRSMRWNWLSAAALFLLLVIQPMFVPQWAAAQVEIPSTYQQAGENESFALYIDHTTLAFKLLDKRSGYIWHSGLDEPAEGDRLNSSWRAFAQSGISIQYLDERATDRRVSIANAEHTLEITSVEQGISAQVTFTEYGLTLGVIVQLEADGLRVEVPFNSIREENPEFRLGQIFLYPFLGATRGSSIPGYMLLPDGTGSLIPFADTTRATNMFYGRYYGPDAGMFGAMPYNPRVTDPYPIAYPVFGMAHGEGENAYLSLVEQGAAYGELQVHPAGIITNFNFLYHAFIYNEAYFQATNRAGAGVTTVQRQPNTFDAVVHYRFLTGDEADYVGMARSYQQYLIERDELHRVEFSNPNMGVRLEFLGGDKERVALWDQFIPMTTIAQMSDILGSLDIPNPEVIYYGWQPYGASNMPPTSLVLEGGLGSMNDLRALADAVKASGGHFSLYYDPQKAIAVWGENGYSIRSDIALAITNATVETFNRQYGYYFTLDALRRRYQPLVADIESQLGAGLALDSIGFMLYSDFREGHTLNRQEAIEAYQNLLAGSSERLGIYRPNDYLLRLAQAYYDMPLGNNGYIYTAESVPFLPIVLAGFIPYYGAALNFSSNLQEDLLRHLEYGIYPSYFVTHEPTANMLNTPSSLIYTSSYAQWGDEIRQTYALMNALLAPVRGQPIVAHDRLTDGVFATTYANGSQIIVNYTDSPFTLGSTTVEPKSAALLERAA